jgi:hypothetical protein
MFHCILDIEYNVATKNETIVFIWLSDLPFWVKNMG